MQASCTLIARQFRLVQRGVTLIEACCVLAIASVLVGAAVPSFLQTKQKVVLQGIAGELATDLHYVRTEAVARNAGVRVSFRTVAGGTCTLIHTGSNADCQCGTDGVAQCVNGASLLKSVYHPAAAGLTVTANVASMRFDPTNGTVSPTGTVTVANANGQSVQHVVNIMGRVRTCSPGGTVNGVKAC
jgi:type IV fimbrial biogenesis protein FimT